MRRNRYRLARRRPSVLFPHRTNEANTPALKRLHESLLIAALAEGKLRGVALDVYVGEFEHEPDRRLWDDERVLITPHISGGSDMRQHRGIDLFCDNLRAYLDGRPLTNVVEWTNGY